MRQWGVDYRILCTQHLLGSHLENHMLAGCILKEKSLKGYIDKGLVEIHNIMKDHNEIVAEMLRRGMNHKSPIQINHADLYKAGKLDREKNLSDLISRCGKCKKNYEALLHARKYEEEK